MKHCFSLFVIICTMLCLLGAKEKDINEINKNIQTHEQRQKDIARQRNNLNLKLSTLGQNIRNNLTQIKKLDLEIQNLTKNIEDNKDQNKNQEEKLQELENKLALFNEQMEKSKAKLSTLILRYMTFSRVLDDEEVLTMDDVIAREAFNILKKQTTADIKNLERQQSTIAKQINDINTNIKQVTQIITTQETKQHDLQAMIEKQKILVDNMKDEMQVYNQRLKEIDMQKKELDTLLSQLNILKKNTQEELRKKKEQERLAQLERERKKKAEEERRKAEIAKKEAEKKAKEEADRIAKTDTQKAQKFLGEQNKAIQREYDTKIKQQDLDSFKDLKRVDSVYHKPETIKYTGKKMRSPLDSYTLEQAFGDYKDPVYGIMVFNTGIALKTTSEDAQVYNIMDGKVIYAKEMSGLKKVVIVEHQNSMHTIYSMLDKIAPTLKPGFIVKQGYVIGRVNDKLNLEIIQAGKHINPAEVIATK